MPNDADWTGSRADVDRWLVARARLLCGRYRLPRSLAEDLAQATWVRSLHNPGTPSNSIVIKAWLTVALDREIKDRLRRRSRRPTVSAESEESALGAQSGREDDPAALAERDDLVSVLGEVIDAFPRPYCNILELAYLRGWTRRQVETWLREWRPIGPDEARRLYSMARRLLGRAFTPDGDIRAPVCGLPKENAWTTTPSPPFARHPP